MPCSNALQIQPRQHCLCAWYAYINAQTRTRIRSIRCCGLLGAGAWFILFFELFPHWQKMQLFSHTAVPGVAVGRSAAAVVAKKCSRLDSSIKLTRDFTVLNPTTKQDFIEQLSCSYFSHLQPCGGAFEGPWWHALAACSRRAWGWGSGDDDGGGV